MSARHCIALVLCGPLALLACSSGTASAPSPLDACKFVNETDVATAFSYPVVKDVAGSSASHQCIFHASSDPVLTVAVNVSQGKTAINTYKAAIGDPGATIVNASASGSATPLAAHEAVPGLGDSAAWFPTIPQLLTTKGETRVDIILGGPNTTSEHAAQALAETILPRVP